MGEILQSRKNIFYVFEKIEIILVHFQISLVKHVFFIHQIASSMVACTFLSAPLMFISAKMITVTSTDPSEYIKQLDAFTFDISIIGSLACAWVLVMFALTGKMNKIPHKITAFLLISQVSTYSLKYIRDKLI